MDDQNTQSTPSRPRQMRMCAVYLTPEEIAYELAIRPGGSIYIPGADPGMLDQEYRDGYDPIGYIAYAPAAEGEAEPDFTDELARCSANITQLSAEVDFILWGNARDESDIIASRFIHYGHRINRIPSEQLEVEVKMEKIKLNNIIAVKKRALEELWTKQAAARLATDPAIISTVQNGIQTPYVPRMHRDHAARCLKEREQDRLRTEADAYKVEAEAIRREVDSNYCTEALPTNVLLEKILIARLDICEKGFERIASQITDNSIVSGLQLEIRLVRKDRRVLEGALAQRDKEAKETQPETAQSPNGMLQSTIVGDNHRAPSQPADPSTDAQYIMKNAPIQPKVLFQEGPIDTKDQGPSLITVPMPKKEPKSILESFGQTFHPTNSQKPIETLSPPTPVNVEAPTNITNVSTSTRNTTQTFSTMNLFQTQQMFSKILGHRKYDGNRQTNAKTLTLQEFIYHMKEFVRISEQPESVVLSQISAFCTGAAFDWIYANRQYVTSIDELEKKLRMRFERQLMDEPTFLMDFWNRKQDEEEDLLDYIDDMRKRAAYCGPALKEKLIISAIVDNANYDDNQSLSVRSYESISELYQFAEYRVRHKRQRKNTNRAVNVKPRSRDMAPGRRMVQAVEASYVTEESEQESGDETPVTYDEEMITALVHAIARVKPWQRKSNRPNHSSNKADVATNSVIKEKIGISVEKPKAEISAPTVKSPVDYQQGQNCWGCQRPNTYQRNCPNCNPQPKNE